MDMLETLFQPLMKLVNKQIKSTTPAQELCTKLDGKVISIRVNDTALAIYFCVYSDKIALVGTFEGEPDVLISGSLITLARLASTTGEEAIHYDSLNLTGDAELAQAFQKLLGYGKPDIEEELSGIIGDVAAHRLGEIARSIGDWGRKTNSTFRQNISEYLQEERRDLPSRLEIEKFNREVDVLRDDVARFEVRLNLLKQMVGKRTEEG
jgi:ubiquinone biosynthesis protein UbiJ